MNGIFEDQEQRADNLVNSQRAGVFVDECGRENPHVGFGKVKYATQGKLARCQFCDQKGRLAESERLTEVLCEAIQGYASTGLACPKCLKLIVKDSPGAIYWKQGDTYNLLTYCIRMIEAGVKSREFQTNVKGWF